MREPSVASLPSIAMRWLAAVRPGFLAASAVPVLIGIAAVVQLSSVNFVVAAMTLIGATLAHAGANVINDVHDHRSGCDEINEQRIFPFTGGSRIIQNGVLNVAQMNRLSAVLVGATVVIGCVLLPVGGWRLVVLGLSGLAIGWAYSAPPFRLSARGLGELAVAIGFGVLIPIGSAVVQTGYFAQTAAIAGLPYGILIATVLLVNQFPDLAADAATGKRNWVVRLGRERAWMLYPLLVALATAVLLLAIALQALPRTCLLALLTVPWHWWAASALYQSVGGRGTLHTPIRLTLIASLTHGLLTAIGLLIAEPELVPKA